MEGVKKEVWERVPQTFVTSQLRCVRLSRLSFPRAHILFHTHPNHRRVHDSLVFVHSSSRVKSPQVPVTTSTHCQAHRADGRDTKK